MGGEAARMVPPSLRESPAEARRPHTDPLPAGESLAGACPLRFTRPKLPTILLSGPAAGPAAAGEAIVNPPLPPSMLGVRIIESAVATSSSALAPVRSVPFNPANARIVNSGCAKP